MAVVLASQSRVPLSLIVFKNDSTAHYRKVLYFCLRAERELFTLYLLMSWSLLYFDVLLLKRQIIS